MDPRFELVTPPASEPVTLAEAKAHAKIEISEDDTLVDGFITTARERVEKAIGRALLEQEWTASLECWPDLIDGDRFRRIQLKRPVISVDAVSVDGVAIASTLYRLSGADLLVSTEVEETGGEIDDAGIVIEFTCGYEAAALPESLKLAVKMLVAHLYDARGATSPQGIYHQLIPEGVQALLQPYIVLEI